MWKKNKLFLMNTVERMLKKLKKTLYASYCHSLLIMDKTFMRLSIPHGRHNTVPTYVNYFNKINLSLCYKHLSL